MTNSQPLSLVAAGLRRASRARGELVWVVVGQGLAFCGSFFSVKMLTSVMGPVEYGKLAFGVTLAGVLQMFLYGPLSQALFRYFSVARERAELPSYLSVIKRFHRGLAIVVVAVAVTASAAVALCVSNEWALVVFFACIYGLATGVLSSFALMQNALRQRKIVAIHQGADPWFRALISLALIYVFRNSGFVVLIGFFCAAALLDISQALFALRNQELKTALRMSPNPSVQIQYRTELLAYATPYLFAAGINSIGMFGDRWTLQYLFGTGQLGIYAALCQIATAPVSVISGMIMQLMTPVIFERAGSLQSEEQKHRSKRLLIGSIALFICAMAIVGVAFAIFGRTVVAWVSSPEFAEYHGVLWIIFVGMVLFHLAQQSSVVGQIHRTIRRYLPCYALNAISTLVLSFVLGRKFGMTGVAAGLLLSNALYLVSVLIVNRSFIQRNKQELSSAPE
jgi:O-antigen/teichoic acid export membrane protein